MIPEVDAFINIKIKENGKLAFLTGQTPINALIFKGKLSIHNAFCEESPMDRRDFLKITGLASSSVFLVSSPLKSMLQFPLHVSARGNVYRGTADGEIHVSGDGGKTWKLHTRFGPDCPILDMVAGRNGEVALQVGYQHYSFRLDLAENGKDWLVGPNSSL
jgi:hypothetical protein